MNVSTMRLVDRWAGVPACVLLSGLRRVASLFPKRAPSKPKSVVFLKLAEQGSTVIAYPALTEAVRRFGAENVYFLVFEQNRFVIDVMDVIPHANVISIRCEGLVGTLWNVLRGIRDVRRLRIDAAVDLEFFARATSVLAFLSGARQRVGLHAFAGDGPYRGDLMTHRIIYNPHIHTSQMFLLQVQALEQSGDMFPAFGAVPAPVEDLPLGTFRPSEEEVQSVERKLCEITGCDTVPPLVLLNANCSDLLPLRRWDADNFVALAGRLLAEDPELRIAFTGAPDEAPPIDELVVRIGSDRCVSLAGRTTLRELLVVYGLSELLITNDSGPAHFATLTGIDVLCLFGPETPELFGSLSPRSHVIWANTACSPCVSAYNNRVSLCRDNICMQRIGVDIVHTNALALLAERRKRPSDDDAWLIPTTERRARPVVIPVLATSVARAESHGPVSSDLRVPQVSAPANSDNGFGAPK